MDYIEILETKYKVLDFDGTYYTVIHENVEVLAHKSLLYVNFTDVICLEYKGLETVYGYVTNVYRNEYTNNYKFICKLIRNDNGFTLEFDPRTISPEYIRRKKIKEILK